MRPIGEIVSGMMQKKPKERRRKTLPNPAWKRTTGGGRGWYRVQNMAPDPVPMTRQVERQNARRFLKMPLGVSQAEWHRHIGATVSKRMKARAARGGI